MKARRLWDPNPRELVFRTLSSAESNPYPRGELAKSIIVVITDTIVDDGPRLTILR